MMKFGRWIWLHTHVNVLKDMGLHYKIAKMGNFMKNFLITILKKLTEHGRVQGDCLFGIGLKISLIVSQLF